MTILIFYYLLVILTLVINDMKNKKWIILCIFIVLALIGAGIYFYYNSNNSNSNDYNAQRTATNDDSSNNENNNNTIDENNTNNSEDTANQNNTQDNNTTNNTTTEIRSGITKEQTISSFSTKIYTKDSSRQNNIEITCNTLNGTIVNAGETFSFCQTVGKATTSKGYEKADIYDHNGKKKEGLGGGNCQVSSTLYNAVLAVPSLVVTERHEHSNNVPYVAKGKDAAVAYGSYDFKFRNDLSNSVKILASTDGSYVYTSLVELQT